MNKIIYIIALSIMSIMVVTNIVTLFYGGSIINIIAIILNVGVSIYWYKLFHKNLFKKEIIDNDNKTEETEPEI